MGFVMWGGGGGGGDELPLEMVMLNIFACIGSPGF